MDASNYLAIILLLLVYKFHVSSSDSCTLLFATSGIISNEYYGNGYSKCWKIIVPSNSYAILKMESFYDSNGGCSYSKVTVQNGNDVHVFCTDMSTNWHFTSFHNITVTHEKNYNSRSRFSMSYRRESFMCIQKDIHKCSDGVCIPQSQVCDGLKQCHDGSDEKGCETGVFAVPGVDESRINGTRWLKEKWSSSSGWQENTHRGIIALYLATERNTTDVDFEGMLILKQLEVQALASLLRNGTDLLTTNQLSMFMNAMIVSCQDPRTFHGFDLVKLLKDKIESSPTSPVSYLALCNAGETLPVNATSDLCNVLNSELKYPFLIDVQAAAVMAFSCINAKRQNGSDNSTIHNDYDQAVKRFKQLQLEDGSFGNIYTTAIVTQALLSAGEDNSKDWKLKEAINYLIKHLNSSHVDFLSMYLILPVLNGKSLSDIGNVDCPNGLRQRSKGGSIPEVKNKLGSKMRIQYYLYIGDDRDIIHSLSLKTPRNITVFEIMQLAQEADAKYKFQWTKIGQKLYIYEIAGIINDFEDDRFWLLHVGKDANSVMLATENPDKVVVSDGAQIVMWYKQTRI